MPNVLEEVIDTSKPVVLAVERLKKSNDMLNQVFSFLPGCEIIHAIAVINQRFRKVT